MPETSAPGSRRRRGALLVCGALAAAVAVTAGTLAVNGHTGRIGDAWTAR